MRWCLSESREMPSRVSSSDVALCLHDEKRAYSQETIGMEGCWTYFSRKDLMMSLADDMLTLI